MKKTKVFTIIDKSPIEILKIIDWLRTNTINRYFPTYFEMKRHSPEEYGWYRNTIDEKDIKLSSDAISILVRFISIEDQTAFELVWM